MARPKGIPTKLVGVTLKQATFEQIELEAQRAGKRVSTYVAELLQTAFPGLPGPNIEQRARTLAATAFVMEK